MRSINKIGPNIEPCGTPQEISSSEEFTPLIVNPKEMISRLKCNFLHNQEVHDICEYIIVNTKF